MSRVRPWTLKNSRQVLRDRWISLRADDCTTHEGAAVSSYYVLEYPDWVNVVALDAQDHLLLVRQYRHAVGQITLELPCGSFEPSEKDPLEAAARELLEETGYGNAARMTLVASLSPNTASHANLNHIVLAEDVSEVQAQKYDAIEVLDVDRVPWREALRLAESGAIMQTTHIASLYLGLRAAGKIAL
jgi:8-oxo-dGTP pyrophosphatase MutT (NUDIX family)